MKPAKWLPPRPRVRWRYRHDLFRRTRFGVLFQNKAWWIGAHYSTWNRRWCINVIPCVTVWVTLPGGRAP